MLPSLKVLVFLDLRVWFGSAVGNTVPGSVPAVLMDVRFRNTAWKLKSGELSDILVGLKCLRSHIHTLIKKSVALFSI